MQFCVVAFGARAQSWLRSMQMDKFNGKRVICFTENDENKFIAHTARHEFVVVLLPPHLQSTSGLRTIPQWILNTHKVHLVTSFKGREDRFLIHLFRSYKNDRSNN